MSSSPTAPLMFARLWSCHIAAGTRRCQPINAEDNMCATHMHTLPRCCWVAISQNPTFISSWNYMAEDQMSPRRQQLTWMENCLLSSFISKLPVQSLKKKGQRLVSSRIFFNFLLPAANPNPVCTSLTMLLLSGTRTCNLTNRCISFNAASLVHPKSIHFTLNMATTAGESRFFFFFIVEQVEQNIHQQ